MKRALADRAALVLTAVAGLAAAGCTPLATREARAARSSLGCIDAALRQHAFAGMPDGQAHCLAAGLIARYCSVSEAMLASIGKEIRDAFGRGNAQWSDLQADRRGIECARAAAEERDLLVCCGGSIEP